MKIMLDCSPRKIKEYSDRYGYDFWQLRTPLTGYGHYGGDWGLDNGCFTEFREAKWLSMIKEARGVDVKPKFVVMPDVVGSARRTLELFDMFRDVAIGLSLGLVLQDGIGSFAIPWDIVDAVFVGGSDEFKVSNEAKSACRTAKILGKWVHVGRVNTLARVKDWIDLCDSIDGSGISRYDHMLENVLNAINGKEDTMFDKPINKEK